MDLPVRHHSIPHPASQIQLPLPTLTPLRIQTHHIPAPPQPTGTAAPSRAISALPHPQACQDRVPRAHSPRISPQITATAIPPRHPHRKLRLLSLAVLAVCIIHIRIRIITHSLFRLLSTRGQTEPITRTPDLPTDKTKTKLPRRKAATNRILV